MLCCDVINKCALSADHKTCLPSSRSSEQVQPLNRVKSFIITNVAWIQLDSEGKLQKNEDLSPGKWLGPENRDNLLPVVHSILQSNTDDEPFKSLNLAHKEQMVYFIDAALKQVKSEHTSKNEDVIDRSLMSASFAKLYVLCIT